MIRAIEESLKLWRGIEAGTIDKRHGLDPGALCEIADEDCEGCPLEENGFGCDSQDSNWWNYRYLYSNHLHEFYYVGKRPTEKQFEKRFQFHVKLMIRHLEICLEKEESNE